MVDFEKEVQYAVTWKWINGRGSIGDQWGRRKGKGQCLNVANFCRLMYLGYGER